VYSVDPTVADTAFIAWFMRSPIYLARAPIKTTPGQLPRIRTEEVASVQINLPPCSEQKKVAAYLRSRMEAIRKARAGLEDEWSAIGSLPAAILRRAFSGEL
jgi:type I restriction enzyme S subunit